mmetsp:Transcript_68325/g.142394  ORF Transcript_68325/g.142394 Transcript_68325/m.142394 type:complete len:355 (-) Transcript_68325:401-1465(-)
MQLRRDPDAVAVELPNEIIIQPIHPGRPRCPEDEIRCPEQRKVVPVHAQQRQEIVQVAVDEGFHQALEFGRVWLVCCVHRSGFECRAQASLLRLLVDDFDRLVSDKQHADLPLHNARHKCLVDQLSSFRHAPLKVLLGKRDELRKRHVLDVVVHRLHQHQLCLRRQRLHRPVQTLIFQPADPNPLTLRPTVLLHHARALRKCGWELLPPGVYVVVSICVREASAKRGDLGEGVFGAKPPHELRVCHGSGSLVHHFQKQLFEQRLCYTLVDVRVNSRDVSVCTSYKCLDFVECCVRVENWQRLPSLFDDAVTDRDRICSVFPSWCLVISSTSLKNNNPALRIFRLHSEPCEVSKQ